MNSTFKILGINVEDKGVKTTLKVFSKQNIIDAVIAVSTENPSLSAEPSAEEIRNDFIRLLIGQLFPEDPSVSLPETKAVPATPEMKPVSEPVKPPAVVKVSQKVVVKKSVAKASEPVVKKLEPELAKVAEPSGGAGAAAATVGDNWLCGACTLPAGNDHRPCICTAFNYSVQAWEDARIFPKEVKVSETKPATENKVVMKVVKVVKKAAPKAAEEVKAPEAPAPVAENVVKTAEPAAEAKKPGRPKKAVKELPRCDARIYGDKVEMEGTKAPNGSSLHCFKPAQCERKGSEKIAENEDGQQRHLEEGEEPNEDEGVQHLCKVCVKRWESRTEKAVDWHGFFDDNGAPETSHFEGGAWYQKKMAAVKKE